MHSFTYTCKTRFSDSDAAGVIHFSRLLCYVEEAEHAALAELGFPIDLSAAEALHWPRVTVSAEYLGPVFPGQEITVRLSVRSRGNSSVTWAWEIHGGQGALARGDLKTVCCRREAGKLIPVPLPSAFPA